MKLQLALDAPPPSGFLSAFVIRTAAKIAQHGKHSKLCGTQGRVVELCLLWSCGEQWLLSLYLSVLDIRWKLVSVFEFCEGKRLICQCVNFDAFTDRSGQFMQTGPRGVLIMPSRVSAPAGR